MLRAGGTTPTPVVVMNTPSPLPCSTTLVSPVTMGTPASRAAAAIDSTMRFRSASGKPSSRMKLALRYSGAAPSIATSLTVPCTARQPMSPPGKNSGEITCAVGGHHEPVRRPAPAAGAVVALAQVLVVEGAREQLFDQLRRGAPAGAVVHVDAAVPEVERPDVVLLHAAHAATTGISRKRP